MIYCIIGPCIHGPGSSILLLPQSIQPAAASGHCNINDALTILTCMRQEDKTSPHRCIKRECLPAGHLAQPLIYPHSWTILLTTDRALRTRCLRHCTCNPGDFAGGGWHRGWLPRPWSPSIAGGVVHQTASWMDLDLVEVMEKFPKH